MIKKEFISQIPIFKFLPEEDYLPLVSLWKERKLNAGEILFRKGDAGASMYVIQHGEIEILLPVDPPVNEVQISVFREKDFFGELSVFVDTPRTATARALENCTLYEMGRTDFITFLMERPSVSVTLLGEIAKRLQVTNELITSLVSKNPNEEIQEELHLGDRVSDKIAEFGGSWPFIFSFLGFMVIWVTVNTLQLIKQPFDVYPFILLNLLLSTIAALQAPVIMMSQNRAQKKDRLKADLDYQVNIKSELMLQQLHKKMDRVMEEELVALKKDVAFLKHRLEQEKRQKR